jgi:hypothetical protein
VTLCVLCVCMYVRVCVCVCVYVCVFGVFMLHLTIRRDIEG